MDPQRRQYLISAASEAQSYPPEQSLAEAWLERNIDAYDDITWQKRVGEGVQLGAEYSPGVQQMAYHSSRKRVDLVAYKDNQAILIELKDHVDIQSVWQALNYASHWRINPKDPPVAAILVIGRTGDPGILDAAGEMGVTVELLPTSEQPPQRS